MNRGYPRDRHASQVRLIRSTLSMAVKVVPAAAVLLIVLLALYPRFCLWHAKGLIRDGRYEEALVALTRLDAKDDAELIREGRYETASALYADARYDEAQTLFTDLGAYRDCADMIVECRYQKAAALQDSGEYEDAAKMFYAIGEFGDAADRYTQCRMALCEQVYAAGDGMEAIRMLLAVGTPEAQNRAGAIALEITGDVSLSQSLLSGNGYTEEELANMTDLAAARGKLKSGRVAVGDYHTVGVTESGRVLATGDDRFGQCGVSDIQNAVQAACGARHTVILRNDGTCAAVGDNSCHQCDVSQWTGVTQIACGAYDTFGLTGDGTVLHCGMTEDEAVASWHDVTGIAAGSYAAACVFGGGEATATHPSAMLEGNDLVQVSVSTACAAGVRLGGRVVSNIPEVNSWTDMIYVSLSPTCCLGITSEGSLKAAFFRTDARLELPQGKTLCVAAGATHSAFLMADGSVMCLGDNGYGECNCQDWDLAQ